MEDKNTWCVYMHTSPSGKVYIGITGRKPEYRWQNGDGYLKKSKNGEYKQPAMANAVLKYGWDNFKHIIFAENLSKEQAENFERLLIALWKTNDCRYGYNIREGGGSTGKASKETRKKISEAQKGRHHTEETRKKISESLKGKYIGENHHNFGKEVSEETRKKISKSLSGKMTGEKSPMYGKRLSEETREKMRQSRLGKPASRRKAVYCIELDRQWDSILAARKELKGVSHISDVINGKRDYAGHHPETGEELHWIEIFNIEEIK